jgi:hypothetical protein
LHRPRLRVVEHRQACKKRREIRRPRQRRRTRRLGRWRLPLQIPDGRCKARWAAARRRPRRIPESSANLLPGPRLSTGCESVARSCCISGYRNERPAELARSLLPPRSSPGPYAGKARGRFRCRWSQRSIRRRHRVGAVSGALLGGGLDGALLLGGEGSSGGALGERRPTCRGPFLGRRRSGVARSRRGTLLSLSALAASLHNVLRRCPSSPQRVVGMTRACGPATTFAHPGRTGRRLIWRRRSQTEQSRHLCHPLVQPKNGKGDLEVALAALSRP